MDHLNKNYTDNGSPKPGRVPLSCMLRPIHQSKKKRLFLLTNTA